jgi:RNA polymerase sigma factor (TIGR02999 family)
MTDTSLSWDPRLYAELRSIAARQMRDESKRHTLHTTALLHEAWLRLRGAGGAADLVDLRAAAAATMRRVRVDAARRRRAARRDAARAVELDERTAAAAAGGAERDGYVLALDVALDRLARQLPELARLVELRFFLGLELGAAARDLGWSLRTTKRRWQMARGWLHREVRRELAS